MFGTYLLQDPHTQVAGFFARAGGSNMDNNNVAKAWSEAAQVGLAGPELLNSTIGGANYVNTIPELTNYLTSLSSNPYVTQAARDAATFALNQGIASINPAKGTYTLNGPPGVNLTVALPQHDVIV